MKEYPSIQKSTAKHFREFDAYVFDKLDGSNLRAEWSRKRGWDKFGTRSRLFDISDKGFGEAIPIFGLTLAEPLAKVAIDNHWERLTVFMEFWGDKSFAGQHVAGDPKRLTLLDANPYKMGIIGPREFLDLFGHLSIPRFLGIMRWSRGFVDRVYRGEVDGITCEGVVGKGLVGRELVMAKAKTMAWVSRVKELYGAGADKIIDS